MEFSEHRSRFFDVGRSSWSVAERRAIHPLLDHPRAGGCEQRRKVASFTDLSTQGEPLGGMVRTDHGSRLDRRSVRQFDPKGLLECRQVRLMDRLHAYDAMGEQRCEVRRKFRGRKPTW
jgi:hypothetical protein